jgi:DNA-binding transcriptional ArsR family regulator
LAVLADPTRRAILERLAHGPYAVGELARGLPVSRPAVSQHLKILKEVGLVIDQAVGTRRLYRLDPTGIAQLGQYLEGFWSHFLESFRSAVENTTWRFNDITSNPDGGPGIGRRPGAH